MPSFGATSLSRLRTCHPQLAQLFHRVVEIMDCTIVCGHRTEVDQHAAYDAGKSQVQYPDSKHNQIPSIAIDVAPYPIPEKWNPKAFIRLSGVVKAEAHHMGLSLRWGGDWDMDDDLLDNKFNDYVHYELIG